MNWIPEQRLWQAVVNQAIHDACNTAWRHELEQMQAFSWFANGGKDFKMVCDMAGYSESYVRGKFYALMAKRTISRQT